VVLLTTDYPTLGSLPLTTFACTRKDHNSESLGILQEVKLEVSVDGFDFDIEEKIIAPRGWGLAGMKENANGRWQVRGPIGSGCGIMIIRFMMVDDRQVIRAGLKSQNNTG